MVFMFLFACYVVTFLSSRIKLGITNLTVQWPPSFDYYTGVYLEIAFECSRWILNVRI